MHRRGFLGLAFSGLAGFALDPERLLWVPGQRTYFLPSTARWAGWEIYTRLVEPANMMCKVLSVTAHTGVDCAYFGSLVLSPSGALNRAKADNLALSFVERIREERPFVSVHGLESRLRHALTV
jgi:hypothetical protein